MNMRMLIDARHREETRVAIVKGNRIEEFDFESAEHKQLKGNIYLAKVTRVEPSLQAAFVDYGGNRHGFLAFSEIHPDYYQIPKEDREALLAEEARHAAEAAALRDDEDEEDALEADEAEVAAAGEDGLGNVEEVIAPEDTGGEEGESEGESDGEGENRAPDNRRKRQRGRSNGDEASDELRRQRMALRRRYKIQDVIRRRQVLLVQVVKEERGNKGAALTTYLSLAGRYCVLMPNTSHGGGISRKISNAADRKRLKSIIADLALPSTMGCIVRTAGLQRTRTEIKRDFDYLARLWDEIRENTLKSSAPALIHNDSDLIKRAIRDIYNRDIEEVIVEGEDGYRAAKDFMKLLMPSHARRVRQYADAVSLFQRFGVEDQLAAMYHPVVQLKSGGYLVINPTEALVSIDINSGRSTREMGIEQTAVATNLEAAREIARQLRLRDMAGLVVIDFIDMEMNSNIRKVEKAMREALKDDRARIQVGRISGFGLMEMSRQRLRTGVLEASTRECPHCEGTGLVRTASSAGLSALRLLEEEAARGKGSIITLRASQEAAFYVLNNKRREIDEIERRYGVVITILSDGEVEGARMSVEASGPKPTQVVTYAPIAYEDEDEDLPEEDLIDEEEEAEAQPRQQGQDRGEDDREGGRRRRRRRRRRGRREDGEGTQDGLDAETGDEGAADEGEEGEESAPPAEGEEGAEKPRSRRGRRGGRRRRGGGANAENGDSEAEGSEEAGEAEAGEAEAEAAPQDSEAAEPAAEPAEEAAPAPRRRARSRKAVAADTETAGEADAEVEVAAEAKPKRTRKKKADTAEAAEGEASEAPAKKPRTRKAKAAVEAAPAAKAVQEAAPVAEAPAEAASEAPVETPVEAPAAAPAEPAPVQDSAPQAEAAPAAETEGASDGESEGASEDGAETEESGPPRRGWWQRTFGN